MSPAYQNSLPCREYSSCYSKDHQSNVLRFGPPRAGARFVVQHRRVHVAKWNATKLHYLSDSNSDSSPEHRVPSKRPDEADKFVEIRSATPRNEIAHNYRCKSENVLPPFDP